MNRAEIMKEMLTRHMEYLVSKGAAHKFSDLMKLDMIDLRDALHYEHSVSPAIINEDVRLPEELDWAWMPKDLPEKLHGYGLIPCIQKGSFRINRHRFLYFEIKEVNVPEDFFVVFIRDYSRMNGSWQAGVEVEFRVNGISGTDINVFTGNIGIISKRGNCEIYRDIPDGFFADGAEKEIWQLVVNNADYVRGEREKYAGNEFADIINLFCAMAYLSNYILMLNKPKAVRRKSAGNSGKKAVVSDISENMPKRIVRNIGSMKISSEKVPRVPSPETVTHYKVAVWKARGGIRHYKNGKITTFAPCVKHRQCLKRAGSDAVPVTLKLHA